MKSMMNNWSKIWMVALFLGMISILSACGKDNGNSNVQANTTPPRNCWNGNCSWSGYSYPQQWQAYPRYNSGPYAGAYNYNYWGNYYNSYYGNNYYGAYSGCQQGFYPYNYYGAGLICVPFDSRSVNNFWTGTWAGGSYFQGCDMNYQSFPVYPNGYTNPCPGRCYPNYQFSNQWGANWQVGTYATYGVCQ